MTRGRYFEDLKEDERLLSAGLTVSEESIIRFAWEWDPQPFHIDREAAKDSIFGGLVSSGLQTLMVTYRLYHDMGLLAGTAVAGLGLDDVRLLRPLKPGDTVRVHVVVTERRPTSDPARGVVTLHFETINQRGECVLSLNLSALVARRPALGRSGADDIAATP